MQHELSLKAMKKEWHGTLQAYLIGFVVSLVLTSASFLLVISQILTGQLLIISIVSLALLQAIIQLRFFLHLGQEAKPRWETVVFYFMLLILLIIALGSLWIMQDLNTRMMVGMQQLPLKNSSREKDSSRLIFWRSLAALHRQPAAGLPASCSKKSPRTCTFPREFLFAGTAGRHT